MITIFYRVNISDSINPNKAANRGFTQIFKEANPTVLPVFVSTSINTYLQSTLGLSNPPITPDIFEELETVGRYFFFHEEFLVELEYEICSF